MGEAKIPTVGWGGGGGGGWLGLEWIRCSSVTQGFPIIRIHHHFQFNNAFEKWRD